METTAQPNDREGIKCLGTVDWKDAWYDFEDVIKKQFEHGGTKYAFDDNSEWTDVLTGMAPAWLAATVSKYCGRLKVFGRERDLIKIFTYAFIGWLQDGCHNKDFPSTKLNSTTVAVKSEHFMTFVNETATWISKSSIVVVGRQNYNALDIMTKFDALYNISVMNHIAMDIAEARNDQHKSNHIMWNALAGHAFVEWFQKGFHLSEVHDEDTSVEKVEVENYGE